MVVLLPLLLIGLATGAAFIIAYGMDPGLAQHAHGLEMIMLTRRLEWPLVTFSLLLCVALLALVIANKRRAWWLLGLAPVLALYLHAFSPLDRPSLYKIDSPDFISIDSQQPLPIQDTDWVVGINFDEQAYALPYAALYSSPLVFITDYDKRILLLWSARANRAVAQRVNRELKSRDLEYVSSPDDTLLIYDRRLGHFIIALTGLTPENTKPVGFGPSVQTHKLPWGTWKKLHPSTKLLRAYQRADAPTAPILPGDAGMLVNGTPAETRIALISTTQPTAIQSDSVGSQPLNTVVGQTRVLILRNPLSHQLCAFDRNVKEDLFPTFKPQTDRRVPEAAMIDSDTNSLWSIDGKAVAGTLKGAQLKELPIEDGLYWGVMKRWEPALTLTK